MRQVQEIINDFIIISSNPAKQLEEIKATGKKAVGCFPEYAPAELVYAAGMFPIGLWGGNVEISKAKEYVPAFCCSVLMADLELGLSGFYKDIDAVIIPSLCDTLKCLGQNFKVAVPSIKSIQFTYPQMRKIDGGVQFLEKEYNRIKVALEEVSGNKITDDNLSMAISIFNENRRALRRFVDVASEHANVVTPSIRHAVIKSGYFCEKPQHTALVNELCDALSALEVNKAIGKRVLLTGIMADDASMLNILSNCGLTVAADDLAQETRQFRYDVPEDGGNAMFRLAKWWQIFEGCSLAYDPMKMRIDMIINDIKKYDINGVIVCMMKFCDPEEYDYPLLKEALEANGIPTLYMEIDQNAEAQAQTRIQAFSEII